MSKSDPPDITYEEQIRYEVGRVHTEGCCSQCLSSVLAHSELHAAFQDEGEDGPIFSGELHVREYGKLFAKYGEPSAAWLHILGSLSGRLGPGLPYGVDRDLKPASEAAVTQMIDTIVSHHPETDFGVGLIKLPPDHAKTVAPVLKILLERGALEPSKLIDISLVIEVGRSGACQYPSDFENPKRLEWWLEHFRWAALPKFIARFREQPDDVIAPLAYGISSALQHFRDFAPGIVGRDDSEIMAWSDQHSVPTTLAAELEPYLSELLSRLDRRQKDGQLLWMCCRYANLAYGERPEHLDPAIRKRLKQMACDELGRLRTFARQADNVEAMEQFTRRYVAFGHYDDLLTFICTFGSIWEALKPLVLALRAMSQPCVPPDLRYWSEPDLDRVPVWSWIPNVAAGVVHRYAKEEERRDARLENLRLDFAAFCLERLKTGEGDQPVEPNAVWREGYIRAVRDLRVNPRGRGHQVLHHARKNDPNPDVRAVADEAYSEMRHEERLPEKRSPRRAILGALWWLRRAHFIALRGESALDQPGALRTRNREGRRTE